jgi:hypothetical protein
MTIDDKTGKTRLEKNDIGKDLGEIIDDGIFKRLLWLCRRNWKGKKEQ